jgi:CO dehydrogenase/acetyl-CoA synthase gamma subunit (corrinoid Fe-S protein)
MNTVQPKAATAPSPLAEQSISVTLTAEIMRDLDDGRPTLIAATESNLGDLRETSPARLRSMVAAARTKLDQIEQLANEHEARDTLRAIVAEHSLNLYEDDLSDLPEVARTFACFAMRHKDGRTIVVVPQGQDPIERVKAVAELVNDIQAQA